MDSIRDRLRKSTSLLTALAFTVSLVAPTIISQSAYASGQFAPRKLTMSSQTPGGISTDANNIAVAPGAGGNGAKARHTYDFTFGTSGATVGSFLVQYCTTPLLGTTCTAPTGMDAATVVTAPTVTGFGGTAPALDTTTTANTGGYFTTVPCSGSGTFRANCILLKRAAPSAITGQAVIQLSFGTGAGTDWIKNPTALGSFYVRLTAFSDIAYTTIVDEAAVAGSVNTNIDITAKVQEKLNFSVATGWVAPTAACTALSGTGAVVLGDPVNGVLDLATAYDAHTYFRLNTNASGGTLVLYSGDTLETSGGTNSITSIGTTATASVPGTSQFGLGLDSGDANHSFTNLTATSPYNQANGLLTAGTTKFAHSAASVTTPVQMASAASGTTVSCDTGSVRYLGNIATTTKAGIYRTTIAYIAVPTF